MIEQLKPKYISAYPNIPDKKDCVDIARKGLAPKGEYCDNCIYFHIDLEAKINPWNEEVERTVRTAKCLFFGDLLASEKAKTPCGISFDRYKKCSDCKLQTDEKIIKQAKELGVSTEELVSVMHQMLVESLIKNLKEKDNENTCEI